jgi:predicted dehydrogenase
MTISIGMVGVGGFAQSFIPLFQAHPLVSRIALCDVQPDRLSEASAKYGIAETYSSLDTICESDIQALVLITQNWMHAPQATQALRAGKHVYSAVPTGMTVEEIGELVQTVEQTGRIYMLGETSYYYPSAIYCRQRHAAGDFGHIVYAEAEYYHDWDHGLYAVAQRRGGDQWLRYAGKPPMLYSTHSTGFVLSVIGASRGYTAPAAPGAGDATGAVGTRRNVRMTHVSCQGVVDRHDDGIYEPGANDYGNVFSNQSALFKMSDGSVTRINEFRRIGHPGTVRMSLFGTGASFEHNAAGPIWLTKDRAASRRLDEELATGGVETPHGTFAGLSRVHAAERLPREFAALTTSGHSGSHPFLVDDFVQACVTGQHPPTNVWAAARYCVPGLIAHESAKRGGELLEIPDFGDGPGAGGRAAG